MKLDLNKMMSNIEYWKNCEGLTEEEKSGFVYLAKELMKRAIDNDGKVDKIELNYPEDYSDSEIFREFAWAIGASVCIKKGKKHGMRMCSFEGKHEIEVE